MAAGGNARQSSVSSEKALITPVKPEGKPAKSGKFHFVSLLLFLKNPSCFGCEFRVRRYLFPSLCSHFPIIYLDLSIIVFSRLFDR